MSIGIIGAGAIGGTLAAALDLDGHDVAVTARGEHLARIRREGLRMDGALGEHVARVAADETLPDGLDLVILATKAQDSRAALGQNRAAIGALPLVIVQNGLRGTKIAHEVCPGADILGGITSIGAQYLQPGRITVTTPGKTLVGSPLHAPESAALAGPVAAALDGILPVEAVARFGDVQWTKLLVNHVNAVPAITGRSIQEVLLDDRLRSIVNRSLHETIRVLRAEGAGFADVQSFRAELLRRFEHAAPGEDDFLLLRMARDLGDRPNNGSTLQSILRGHPTEIDYLNGEVVRVGARHGIPVPVNAALTRLVHAVERSGRFLAADELEAALPARSA